MRVSRPLNQDSLHSVTVPSPSVEPEASDTAAVDVAMDGGVPELEKFNTSATAVGSSFFATEPEAGSPTSMKKLVSVADISPPRTRFSSMRH